jgi:hypothetical protein
MKRRAAHTAHIFGRSGHEGRVQRMLDRSKDLALMLSQLQNMLENLRMAQSRQVQGNGNKYVRL